VAGCWLSLLRTCALPQCRQSLPLVVVAVW
jgi:hypothetical protein